MLNNKEIHLLGDGENKRQRIGSYNKIRKLANLPGFRVVLPFARLVAGVAELPGRMSIQAFPADTAEPDDQQAITVISANLWHDWPKHHNLINRMEAFARMVEEQQADVLLLQEVARTTDLQSDKWLANRLGMSFVYSRANGHLAGLGFEEGLAIFSRHPLGKPVLRQLNSTGNWFVHRLALGATIVTPFGDLQAFSVHLGINSKQNSRQSAYLRNWVQEVTGSFSAVVGGDFNVDESSRSIGGLRNYWLDTFRHIHPLADGATHEIRWPWGSPIKRSRLDYIFLKAELNKWKVVDAFHLETPGERHSDHRAVLLRLALVD